MPDIRHTNKDKDLNPDPITGEPGSHPVGTGVGAAGGGATGAAIGTAIGGPIGGAVGAVIGAIAGGLAGKGVAEAIDPTAEDAYWREHHREQPFAHKEHDYDTYAPAYRTGYEGYSKYEPGTKFEEAEPTLREDYEAIRRQRLHTSGTTTGTTGTTGTTATTATGITSTGETTASPSGAGLAWDEAKHAAKAAWHRVERGEAVRVPLTEEQVKVSKREVEEGAVRLRKVVKTETVNQPVELKREEVVVERVSKDDPNAIPADAFKEGEIHVPVKREEAVVEKTAHVTGEVKVRKEAHTDTKHVQETVRKEDVKVETEGQGRIRREP